MFRGAPRERGRPPRGGLRKTSLVSVVRTFTRHLLLWDGPRTKWFAFGSPVPMNIFTSSKSHLVWLDGWNDGPNTSFDWRRPRTQRLTIVYQPGSGSAWVGTVGASDSSRRGRVRPSSLLGPEAHSHLPRPKSWHGTHRDAGRSALQPPRTGDRSVRTVHSTSATYSHCPWSPAGERPVDYVRKNKTRGVKAVLQFTGERTLGSNTDLSTGEATRVTSFSESIT